MTMSGKGIFCSKSQYNRKNTTVGHDIEHPGVHPGDYAHIGKEPNTNHLARRIESERNRYTIDQLKETKEKLTARRFAVEFEYEKNVEKKTLQREIDDRVQEKLNDYERNVERRREKLRNLLCEEEKMYYYETVQSAQKGTDLKLEDMKIRAELLKAQRERERLEVVHQKRIEQYRKRCQEVIPKIIKKNLMESKSAQLQQMRENEARRESERELNRMWDEFTLKEIETKKQRDVQETIQKKLAEKKMLKEWDQQMKGKEMLKIEMDRIAAEDKIEMEKMINQLEQETRNALSEQQEKKNKAANELLEQIAIQQQLKGQRKKDEMSLNEIFKVLSEREIQKEKSEMKNTTAQNKHETALYRKHLKQLEEERKLEAKKFDELLEVHRKEVEAKQQEARCKITEAKLKLQREVLAERDQQLKYKQKLAEEELKAKEDEKQFSRQLSKMNAELRKEKARLDQLAVYEYRQDLQKQIEYNNMLRQREKEEAEKELANYQQEEQKYLNIVQNVLTGEIKAGSKHPFRRTLEQYDCYCPNT